MTEAGVSLGRIHDLTGELDGGRLRITGLVVGRVGLMARMGVGTGSGGGGTKRHDHPSIPWSRVARVGREVVLRD